MLGGVMFVCESDSIVSTASHHLEPQELFDLSLYFFRSVVTRQDLLDLFDIEEEEVKQIGWEGGIYETLYRFFFSLNVRAATECGRPDEAIVFAIAPSKTILCISPNKVELKLEFIVDRILTIKILRARLVKTCDRMLDCI